MAARPRARSLWFPTACAVVLHLAAGAWWLAGSRGAAFATGGSRAATVALVAIEAPSLAAATPTARPPERTSALPALPTAPPAITPPAPPTVARVAPAPLGVPDPSPSSGSVVAPLEPAYLAGEPLIDLGPDEALLNGRLALRLVIDDTGHVVDSETLSHEGLSEAAATILVQAFTGYVYVPARRAGRALRSVVTMVITVRDGQGATEQLP